MRGVSLLILVLVAAPAAALVTRPLAGRANPPALRLRGGLGDIDSMMVAKVATGLSSASAVFVALAPEKAAEVSNSPIPFRITRGSAAFSRRTDHDPTHLPFASRAAAQPC